MITADRAPQKPDVRVHAGPGIGMNASGAAADRSSAAPRLDAFTRALLVSVPLLWAALAAVLLQPRFQASDLALYYDVSRNAMRGMVPYRDFAFEYPPLALVPMILPRVFGGGRSLQFPAYQWLFLVENTVWLALLEYHVVRIARNWMRPEDLKRTIVCFGALALIATPFVPWRLDLFLALLTAAALLAVVEERPGAAGAMIGLGFATKLYPVVLLPVLVAWYAAHKNWRSVFRIGAATAVTSVLAFLPFVLRAPEDILSFIRYHAMRGLEIESVAGGILTLEHLVRGLPLAVVTNYGAMHLRASAADTVLRALPALFIVAIGLLTFVAFRRFQDGERGTDATPALCNAVLASLLVFILANKVFSPQYLAWLLPFLPFLSRGRSALAVAVFALTIAIFPYSFDNLVLLRPGAVLLLNARNFLAVALAVCLVVDLNNRRVAGAALER